MEKYDIVMVFPALGKTTVSEEDSRFVDCDTFKYHYRIPNKLSHLPIDKLKGSDSLIPINHWEDTFIESLEHCSGVPLVNTNILIYNKLVELGKRVLVVLPLKKDFDLVMHRIRDRDGIDYDDSWVSWFKNLYSEFGRANVVEYIGASELSERLKGWKENGYL